MTDEIFLPEVRGVRPLPEGSWRDGLIAVLLSGLMALSAWPVSKIPLGDDAAFADTARVFAATGHIHFAGWASMVQGWQILWGALFVRLFGYSAGVLDVSTVVVGLLAVHVWHGVLLRFGISRRGALLGTLALGCSPLYLPVMVSYLTDAHGVLAIVLCISMCQRAVLARSERATMVWLAAAGLVNVVDGSVRQVCWLGALVMVPATSWYLRRRRGALAMGVLTTLFSIVAVAAILHWYYAQPWTFPEKLIAGPVGPKELKHFAMQWVETLLLAVVALLPLAIAWVSRARDFSTAARCRIGAVLAMASAAVMALSRHPATLGKAVVPWIEPVFENLGMPRTTVGLTDVATLTLAERAVLSVLIAGLGWAVLEQGLRLWKLHERKPAEEATRAMFWILGPYTLVYAAAISGRAMFAAIQDRYLLLLMPPLLVAGLYVFERKLGPKLPAASWVALAGMAVYGLCGFHSANARALALDRLEQRVESAGIPRSAVVEGFGKDIWYQVGVAGHVNNPAVTKPLGSYDASVKPWTTAKDCVVDYDYLIPAVHPKYYLGQVNGPVCFVPAGFAPEPYNAWLPPFHREVQVLRTAGSADAGRQSIVDVLRSSW